MMGRISLAVAVVAIAAGSYWLWRYVPGLAIGHYASDGSVKTIAVGWSVLASPAVFATIFVGTVAMTLGAAWVITKLVESEANEMLTKIEAEASAKVKAAEDSAAEAINQARQQERYAHDERLALASQSAAAAERVRQVETWAKAEVSKARAETSQQSLRAQNAICAAERIKRKIEGKARLEVRKSH